MNTKAAQYLNEIVSLSILVLMIVALAAGQADGSRVASGNAEDLPGSQVMEVSPARGVAEAGSERIADVLILTVGGLDGRQHKRAARPAGVPTP